MPCSPPRSSRACHVHGRARGCRLSELFEFAAASSRFLPKYDQRAAQEVHASRPFLWPLVHQNRHAMRCGHSAWPQDAKKMQEELRLAQTSLAPKKKFAFSRKSRPAAEANQPEQSEPHAASLPVASFLHLRLRAAISPANPPAPRLRPRRNLRAHAHAHMRIFRFLPRRPLHRRRFLHTMALRRNRLCHLTCVGSIRRAT